jgi:hypothetical protein
VIEATPAEVEGGAAATPAAAASSSGAAAASTPIEAKPVERMVEARSADDSMASMVRCLYFADTFIVNGEYSNTFFLVPREKQ